MRLLSSFFRTTLKGIGRPSMKTDHDLYNELAFYTLAHPDPAFIHQNVVDAFAAQHADESSKPIYIVFALIGFTCASKRTLPASRHRRRTCSSPKRAGNTRGLPCPKTAAQSEFKTFSPRLRALPGMP